MASLIFLMVAFFLVGIILLTGKPSQSKMPREDYLLKLAKYVEGTLEPIEGGAYENSFRINFEHSGKQFVYEDLEKPGFKDKIYFATVRVQTPRQFSLVFSEKERSMKIRSDIFISSEISAQHAGKNVQLNLPDSLKDVAVLTNDIIFANRFLQDKKISSIFNQLKKTDSRGYSIVPVEIVDGTITLSISSEAGIEPNLISLKRNISSIDNYADMLMTIVKKLEEL